MIQIYSHLNNDDEDVITEIIKDVEKHSVDKLLHKIVAAICCFCQNMLIDWRLSKNLDWPVHEFRISIPNSDNLLRILFVYEKDKIMLLTTYLIKPDQYWKKQEIEKINNGYDWKIELSKKIYNDFKTKKSYNYVNITNLVFKQ